jgi:tape measure domain-containing protein
MATGSPELRLGISFDLQSFKTVALPSLAQAASSFTLPIAIKFDRTSINEEMRLLGRQLGQRKYRIDLDDTSIKSAIAQADKLAGKLSGVRGAAERARALGSVISTAPGAGGVSAPQVQSIFGAAKELGIVKGAVDRTRKELVAELQTGFASAGEEAMSGLIRGILKGEGQLQGVAASLGAKLLQALEQSLEIRSPSRKMFRIGQQAGQGFNDGLIASLQEATRNAVGVMNASLRKLDRIVELRQRKARAIAPGQPGFELAQREAGSAMGQRERVQNRAEALQLRGAAGEFEGGSYQALSKLLQSLQIEASEIKPNTADWNNLQKTIAQVNFDLQKADRLAEEIQMRENLGAYAPGSLASLESRLVILKSRAREIAPDTSEWKALNREIQKAERLAERASRKPITKGQRLGAAGGAFLYGGGMGGGIGSALGGVAGGLMGGVPGAFTGAAIGQVTDSIMASVSAMTTQASALMQMQRGLAMASIDAKDFAEAQATVASMSQRLLMPLEQTTRLFTQLRVNTKQYNLSVQDTAKIMEGTALAIMATGGSSEDLEGAMRAVVQIMSKGGVQAEELRGQLGERFPGAVVKFAQANKLSFEQLQEGLEQGKIGIKEFVAFAEKNYTDYGAFSKQLATAPEFAGKRLQIAFEQLQLAIGQALGPAGADIQNFSTQAVRDLTKFIADNKDLLSQLGKDFAVTFAGIVSVVSETAKFIAKVLGPVLGYIASVIRQLRVMAGAADAATAKAEMDAAKAIIQRTGRGRDAYLTGERRSGSMYDKIEFDRAQERLARAEKRFKAAGGLAALPTGQPQNLTFGGAGASMPLERPGKPEKPKKDKELKEFVNDRIDTLRKRLEYEKTFIDASLDLVEREKTVQKARLDLQYGEKIVDEQLAAAQRESLQYRVQDRARFLAEQAEQAKTEKKTLQARFQTAIASPLLQANEQLADTYTELTAKMQLASQGRFELNESEKAEIDISRTLVGLKDEEIETIQGQIDARRQLAAAIDSINIRLTKQASLFKLNNELRLAGMIDPRLELREKLRQENPLLPSADIEEMAGLQERIDKTVAFRDQMRGLASSIGDSFGTAFKDIISGSASAQQALAGFFQSVASSFADMAAKMIAEWVKMQIIGLVQSLLPSVGPLAGMGKMSGGGFGSFTGGSFGSNAGISLPGLSGEGALAGGGGFYSGVKFANGGIVTGPTLGLVGEGRYNEAVVPLPDGRSIPVDLQGSGRGEGVNVVVNVDAKGTDVAGDNTSARELGRVVSAAVQGEIIKQQRPGGLLAGRR